MEIWATDIKDMCHSFIIGESRARTNSSTRRSFTLLRICPSIPAYGKKKVFLAAILCPWGMVQWLTSLNKFILRFFTLQGSSQKVAGLKDPVPLLDLSGFKPCALMIMWASWCEAEMIPTPEMRSTPSSREQGLGTMKCTFKSMTRRVAQACVRLTSSEQPSSLLAVWEQRRTRGCD
eukprot:1957291-Amphidinium_carterae.2